ncbi:hypothetical protein IGI04_030857 [Brassica rapa subsp. trilocularis]|uniref:Uncharacterized protein n=1 Tax=Brassica rapa subsp. trilocularis TaxID=1813537 RepID=A0ABQ7LVX3_BRACM|nr:hypothetical protein IGI04_030857 [Brassica rapa subsp. trilocularis]
MLVVLWLTKLDVPWGSAPDKTDMHGLIIGSSNDICSLFDSYLLNHEASTHEITWRMFSTQLRSSSKKNQIKRSSYVIFMLFTNQVIFSSREFRPPEKLEMANLLSDEPTVNSIMLKVIMFGLQRKNTKEKSPRPSASQSSFKSSLNYFDECVSVQEKPNRWSNEHVNTSKGESDPRRRLLQFDVQQFCDNFVKGVDKALKDVSKSQKKSTSTRAPVAEPSLFISKKAQGESENHFEELKDFSDSLPIFDESDEELIESLMFCEKDCDLPSLETEFNLDNEQAIVELTVFEEEPLDFPHQCPCIDTRICLDDDLGPIFDEEDEPGPVFDEEVTSITSIAMENYLCFDPGTTPAPLPPDLQEHCEEPSSLNYLPDMFVKVSTDDVIRFDLDKMKDFFVSKSVFDNMINSLKIFEPDKCLDQSRFQNVNGITSGIILSFDQFLEHNKGFHLLGRPFDLDLQQTDFCAEKSLDSFVCKGNGFDLSSSRHVLITDELFASSYALEEIMIQKLLEQKSLETENDFRDLEFCGSVLQPDLLSFETDKTWYFLRSLRDNGVVLSSDDILVYNTFFEKCLELLINDSQTELKLVCSDVGKDMPILKMNTVVAYLDKILVCNVYFDLHLDRLKSVLLVLGNDILIFDLNKYLSCTFDPGLLVFVLSIQERQVQPLNESIGRAQQPQIWRSFVVQTGYLDTSDRGSVQGGYLNIPKAWNLMKIFTDEKVMNFLNRRFFSPSIREYQISKRDSCPRMNRPEPKPILHEPKLTCLSLAHVLDDYPKGLDPDLDVLKIEKPFDYFFRRFDVVSLVVLNEHDKHDQFPRRASAGECLRTYILRTWNWKYLREASKIDLRSNPFEEGGNDVPWGCAPGKTDMHGLIIGSSNDICSLFDSYLLNHEASTHEITWRMFSTQLRSSSKKNQIKRSSYVIVMLFTNQVIFSSREFRPPEKLEMANLLSDEPTVNSIMLKVIIHVLNVQKSIGLDGFQKDSKTSLFSPNGETDKILAKRKDGFRPGLKGTCLGPYQEYILHLSKSWSWLYEEVVQFLGEVISKFRSFFCWTVLNPLGSEFISTLPKSDPYFGSIKALPVFVLTEKVTAFHGVGSRLTA